MKPYSGIHKLGEECCELGASVLKLEGKAREPGASEESVAGLRADMLKEMGDVRAALRYTMSRLSKEERLAVRTQERLKVERHRKRQLP